MCHNWSSKPLILVLVSCFPGSCNSACFLDYSVCISTLLCGCFWLPLCVWPFACLWITVVDYPFNKPLHLDPLLRVNVHFMTAMSFISYIFHMHIPCLFFSLLHLAVETCNMGVVKGGRVSMWLLDLKHLCFYYLSREAQMQILILLDKVVVRELFVDLWFWFHIHPLQLQLPSSNFHLAQMSLIIS